MFRFDLSGKDFLFKLNLNHPKEKQSHKVIEMQQTNSVYNQKRYFGHSILVAFPSISQSLAKQLPNSRNVAQPGR